MAREDLIIGMVELPLVVALLLMSSLNVSATNKPIVAKWLRIALSAARWLFAAIWLIGWLGAFSAYLDVPDKVAWAYFAASLLVRVPLDKSKGKLVANAPKFR